MGCLEEETVIAFVGGALSGNDLLGVERHLLGCSACSALVAVAAPATVRDWRREGVTPPQPGGRIGRYRLVRLVGRGGVGEVWAAYDPELDRNVAIKILRADTDADDVERARLLREAQAVARLSHPNVITLYDVGTAAGRVFLTMRLVEGQTLEIWLDRERRSREEILAVFAMAGRGLAAAHGAGIVHRDFKPQNVMVSPEGIAHVMDFGLAAVTVAEGSGPRLTRRGEILGTPLYMAPEQLLGQTADPRADQYSFCVALWEALYGQRPFEGGNLDDLRAAVLADGDPLPRAGSAGVPTGLRTALLRGLSRDREDRYPNMEALLAALARGTRRANRVGATATIVLTLGVLAAGTFVVRARRAPSPLPSPCAAAETRVAAAWPSAGEAPRRASVRSAFLASGEPDALDRHERTIQALDDYVKGWREVHGRLCGAGARRRAEGPPMISRGLACLDADAQELGALTTALGRPGGHGPHNGLRAALELPPVAGCGDPAVAPAGELPASPGPGSRIAELTERLRALRAEATIGDDRATLELLATLVREVREAGGSGAEALLAEALLATARVRAPFDPEGAVPMLEEALRHAEATRDDALDAEAATQLLAIAGGVQHRFEAADRWVRTAEAIFARAGARLSVLRGRFLVARGNLGAARGQWRLAAADFGAATESDEGVFGASHPELGAALAGEARAALALGEPARALAAANRALSIAAAVLPADSYEVAVARSLRGAALAALARMDDARPELATARDVFERVLGADHAFVADPLGDLGIVALAQGRPEEARGLLERAWELRSTHLADAGARERTAFALARAIWESAPEDRDHALELAHDAHDGLTQIPDLWAELDAVSRWLEARAHPLAARNPG